MRKKICNTCGKELPIEKFSTKYDKRRDKTYIYNKCIDCMIAARSKREMARVVQRKGAKIQCVYDPTGTYTKSWFIRGAFKETLKAGYWPPGSKWKYGNGKCEYVVRGNELWHKLYDNPFVEVKSEKQRLVKVG